VKKEKKSSPVLFNIRERIQGLQDGEYYNATLVRVERKRGRGGVVYLLWVFAILEGSTVHHVPAFSPDDSNHPDFQRIIEALIGRELAAGDAGDVEALYGNPCVVKVILNGNRLKIAEIFPKENELLAPPAIQAPTLPPGFQAPTVPQVNQMPVPPTQPFIPPSRSQGGKK